jgi:O-antigen ligase
MLPAFLHVVALLICLNVQSMGSPLAGAWLPFFLAGCILLFHRNQDLDTTSSVWRAALLWMFVIVAMVFFINPIPGAASVMWVLIALPLLAISLGEADLKNYLWCFGGVVTVYAVGLIVQYALHVTYDVYNLGDRYAWPLLDPNNGAAVINTALIPALYLALFKGRKWFLWFAVLLLGLAATGSRTGIAVALLAMTYLFTRRYGLLGAAVVAVAFTSMGELVVFTRPDLLTHAYEAFASRYPIWRVAGYMAIQHPWRGLGLGMFQYYYNQVRTEDYTGGGFAHNDVLQMICELGFPATLAFIWLVVTTVRKTVDANGVAALTMLAIFIEAMVEFQFYTPAISMLMGLALGYHIIKGDRNNLSYLS